MIGEYLATGLAAMSVLMCAWIVMAFPLHHAGLICGEDAFGHPRIDVMLSTIVWLGLGPMLVGLALGVIIIETLIPMVS